MLTKRSARISGSSKNPRNRERKQNQALHAGVCTLCFVRFLKADREQRVLREVRRRKCYLFPPFSMFDPMADLASGAAPARDAPTPTYASGGRAYAQDIHSVTIHARQRTFYVDLKQSGNGKFVKISEKSRGGQKTTVMFDVEDLDKVIAALEEMRSHL